MTEGNDITAWMQRCDETAIRVLREHDDHSSGWCLLCHTPWPCKPVLLADNNLTLIG